MYPRTKNYLEDYDKNRLKRRVLRCSVKQNVVYYFDDDGIFQKISLKEAYDLGLEGAMLRSDGEYAAYELYATELPAGEQYFSRAKKVIATLKVGMTIDDFLQLWKETPPNYREKPSGVRRFITKIERPEIERFPENYNDSTFDYITVEAYVASTSDNMRYIKEHSKEIKEIVLEKVADYAYFKKYNVSVNYLKMTKMAYSDRLKMLQFTFELKEKPHTV